jgi:hypothetical protein
MDRKKPKQRASRSIRFKRYEVLYEDCMKKAQEREGKTRKKSRRPIPKKSPKKSHKHKSPIKKSRARHLNSYQEFVRSESKKSIYKHMAASERMKAIGKAWKAKNE